MAQEQHQKHIYLTGEQQKQTDRENCYRARHYRRCNAWKVSPLAMDTKGYTNGKINNTYERISYLYVRSKVVYPVMASHTHIVAITTQNIASAPL